MSGKILEIQYLRVIAVLFVFLFHLDKENFQEVLLGLIFFSYIWFFNDKNSK